MADDNGKPTGTAKDQRKRERRADERRAAEDRRTKTEARDPERRSGSDRRAKAPEGERRKVERRINEYRLKPEVLEFINAVNHFKTVHSKPFPTWSEIFEIFTGLGYRKAE